MITTIKNSLKFVLCATLFTLPTSLLTSCSDFFEQESDHVMFADQHSLDNASDTIYSVTGIMKKLQKLADRTILLGEARGDLVDVTEATSADLRNVALFDIDDNNVYNQPRDYYAVINNCNYFLAHVDTAIRNSRSEQLFLAEMATVKAYRAWTYLQLAINYGSVPFILTPIMTKEEAERMEKGYHQNLQYICDELIKDLTPLTSIQYLHYDIYNNRWVDMGSNPVYGDIGYKTDSRLFYFPITLLLGELNLWGGHYKEAAQWYYKYISERNGTAGYFTGTNYVFWANETWTSLGGKAAFYSALQDETYNASSELITMIPGDSIPYNGNYQQLRNIFNSFDAVTGEYHVPSLSPSKGLSELSATQVNCIYNKTTNDTIYAPADAGWESVHRGDLRLYATTGEGTTIYNGNQVTTQTIYKYNRRNAHIWRRQMVWLHFAEALNAAGYPRFAYQILTTGLSNAVIRNKVIPHYRADSTWIKTFNFDDGVYKADTSFTASGVNMLGIHTRGSGWAFMNKHYPLPDDPTITDSLTRIAYQQKGVDSLLINENALELAFEGYRYYDLLRYALRKGDPKEMADKIYGRKGKANSDEMKSAIKKDLYNINNWYLQWDGKIGIKE